MLVVLMALDLAGNISLSLQIAILFLLILGLPLARGPSGEKNFIRHGYSTVAALILHTLLILLVMIPTFTGGFNELNSLTLITSITVWSHVVLGTAAEVLGIVIVAAWALKGISKMACVSWRKWMMPTFIIWVVAVVNGALVHIFGLL